MAENGDKEQKLDSDTKICEQIEYYFGDHNLPRDKFLKQQILLDDGWVPLETMIKFNRLSKLTTDFNTILQALKKSKTELLEINEEKCKIRRSPAKPLPELNDEYKNSLKHKSVYIKGFPTSAILDDVKEWLKDKGPIENIQMRRTLQREFKGSIFIIFNTDDDAKKFLENRNLKYKDNDMTVLSREEYHAKKNEERKLNKSEEKAKSKQVKKEAQKQAEDAERKLVEERVGSLLKFSGDLDNMTSREDLHALFQTHGDIEWIDFSRGAKEGIVLFKMNAKEALDKAKAANSDNLKLKGKDVKWELIEGDTEKEALKKILEGKQESFNKRKGRDGRKFKGKGRGGKGNDSSSRKRTQFQGKKKTFDSSDDEDDMEESESPQKASVKAEESAGTKNGAAAAPGSPKKRSLDDKAEDGPAVKQSKTEVGDQ
ncbi:lupus La protein homolog A [Xenopus laevis]|uniref:Lupus La protein homolog A n=1 Tax=Xenopus laevis TaxID=8355 RepID=LAA_XENLA|nr:lupus La protein homolog A [Xenopus laevis]P28048.1 RecName: Full=Lupus La protein homolog A; AltName: Full=La autoantigen homolog A; AltName: Full=La ribonucleoprotein A [Xenopus laevis]CAA48715.1 La protein form A [Xenopus laevis]